MSGYYKSTLSSWNVFYADNLNGSEVTIDYSAQDSQQRVLVFANGERTAHDCIAIFHAKIEKLWH